MVKEKKLEKLKAMKEIILFVKRTVIARIMLQIAFF